MTTLFLRAPPSCVHGSELNLLVQGGVYAPAVSRNILRDPATTRNALNNGPGTRKEQHLATVLALEQWSRPGKLRPVDTVASISYPPPQGLQGGAACKGWDSGPGGEGGEETGWHWSGLDNRKETEA